MVTQEREGAYSSRPGHLLSLGVEALNRIEMDAERADAMLYLALHCKDRLGAFDVAAEYCGRLLDFNGPEADSAKALLREMRLSSGARELVSGAPLSQRLIPHQTGMYTRTNASQQLSGNGSEGNSDTRNDQMALRRDGEDEEELAFEDEFEDEEDDDYNDRVAGTLIDDDDD